MTATSKNGSGSVRVLLASASAVRLAGLEALVKSAPSLRLAGKLSNQQAIFARASESKADVVLVDLERESSLALTTKISSPVVLLIDNPDPNWTAQALRFGVRAILARDAKPDEILHAVKAADSGLVLLTAEVTRGLAEHVRAPAQKNDEPLEQLTARELEVLAMLAEGLGNRQIADRLMVSDHTIKFHISSILDKLDASTRTEAVTTALRTGLILL
jgi:DNA-binding NarL/FixJ family response regulator